MRITIAQGAFLPVPPLMGGAVEKVWHGLATEFARAGHEVTHISRRYGDLPRQECVANVRHLRVPGFDTPDSMLRLKLLDLRYALRVRRILPDADLVVTHTFWLPVLIRAARFGKVYIHAARYPKGQMRLYRHTACIQTVSTAVAQAIVEQTPAVASLVSVVPYPLPDAAFVSPKRDPNDPFVLYVGRIHPEKGIELLLDAFQIVAPHCNWRLVLVGPWQTQYGGGGDEFYSRLANAYPGLTDRIEWVGPVFDPVALLDFYRRASLFVYPSLAARGETFGLAPLEAMAASCPVVVSNLACFRDYLDPGQNGSAFPHDGPEPERALAQTLLNLIKAPAERNRIAEEGRRTAEGYTMGQVARHYLADFHRVLEKGPV
jgi:glycosyltransferase involved in cell wall biosynthesis